MMKRLVCGLGAAALTASAALAICYGAVGLRVLGCWMLGAPPTDRVCFPSSTLDGALSATMVAGLFIAAAFVVTLVGTSCFLVWRWLFEHCAGFWGSP